MGKSVRAKNLVLGVGADLLIHINGVEAKLRSTLVGVKPEEYLLIEAPKVSGIEAHLFNGNRITVILMTAGTVYGFESTILNAVDNPSRLAFISFPEIVEIHELRESNRVNCYLSAVVTLNGHSGSYDGVILDISRFGCSFNAVSVPRNESKLFQLGQSILLTFELPDSKETKTLSGEIRNLNLDDRIISVGIQFDSVSDDMQRKIDGYIACVSGFFSSQS